ncbi:MAG TPA: hypothetical protein DCZ95_12495 [Verrucomicrobia bacterium]|nr:hypothetical protein [Verrucomicrobiota bacterium]
MMLIGIAGRARTGKDTLAGHMINRHGFVRWAFADVIKHAFMMVPGVSADQLHGDRKEEIDPHYGFAWRVAMQRFGDTMRGLNPDFFIQVAERALPPEGRVVISDIRFENEAEFVRSRGLLIHLRRPKAPAVAHHISEQPLGVEIDDVVIPNTGTPAQMFARFDELFCMWSFLKRLDAPRARA